MNNQFKKLQKRNSALYSVRVDDILSYFGSFDNRGLLVLDEDSMILYLTIVDTKPRDSINSLVKKNGIVSLGGIAINDQMMFRGVYDKNDNNIVDKAEALYYQGILITSEDLHKHIINTSDAHGINNKANSSGNASIKFKVANGESSSDAVNFSQLQNIIGGQNTYILKGFWNPETNLFPSTEVSIGKEGWYWIVDHDGINSQDENRSWIKGDWIVYGGGGNGTSADDWLKISNPVDSGAVYTPLVHLDTESQEDHGGIKSGTKAGDLNGKTMSEMFDKIVFPTVEAKIGQNKSLTLIKSPSLTIVEVGTIHVADFTSMFDRGTIINGNGILNPNGLVGYENSFNFFFDDSLVDTNETGQLHIEQTILKGSNIWYCSALHNPGEGQYYDNTGEQADNLDSYRIAGNKSSNNINVMGRQKIFYGVNVTPTNSGEVKLMPSEFLNSSDEGEFNLVIPDDSLKIAIAIPRGKNIKIQYVESSYADVTAIFTKQELSISDGGVGSLDYDVYTNVLPAPYGVIANYKIIVT